MQARTAARELALILFSQFNKQISSYQKKDFEEIILKSVRILTNNSTEDLKVSLGHLLQVQEFIDEYEANHEINLKRPLEVSNIPVPIPMTSDMNGYISSLLRVVEKTLLALEIAEMATLEEKSDVKDYVLKIADSYKNCGKEIDALIQEYAIGWDISRLIKMDKDILRIAIIELLYIKAAPVKVIVDEALELAKKYSTEDSASFINGILAKIIEVNKLK